MKKLTYERANELLRYDEETGKLYWDVPRSGIRMGDEVKKITNGYIQVCVDGIPYYAHQVIWLLKTGEWPKSSIYRLDGDRTNNKWSNLTDSKQYKRKNKKKVVKPINFGNLSYMSKQTDMSISQLNTWKDQKPELFEMIALGCMCKKASDTQEFILNYLKNNQ